MILYKLCQTLPNSQKRFKMNWCRRHAPAWVLHVVCFVTFKAEAKSLNVRETFRIQHSTVCRECLTFTTVLAGGILVSWMLIGGHRYLWPVLADIKSSAEQFSVQTELAMQLSRAFSVPNTRWHSGFQIYFQFPQCQKLRIYLGWLNGFWIKFCIRSLKMVQTFWKPHSSSTKLVIVCMYF